MSMFKIQTGRQILASMAIAGSIGAVSLAGCGGSDHPQSQRTHDEASVRKVLNELQRASMAGDGTRICTQIFTPKLADSVTRSAKSGSCRTEVRQKLSSPTARLTVENVHVADAANATATVKEASGNTSTVYFVRQSGRWRIRSIVAVLAHLTTPTEAQQSSRSAHRARR